jgi:hypothetical protein
LPNGSDDEVLARLRKLTQQLDAAQASAKTTAAEVTRAKQTTERTARAVKLHKSARVAAKAKPTRASRKRKRAAKKR